MTKRMIMLTVVLALMLAAVPVVAQDRVVNIYSSRHYGAIEQPFIQFEAETGIRIQLSQGSPRALLERLRAEDDRTPADVFLAIDAGVLSLAAEEGLLQAVDSEILNANIDELQRDPDGYWFGLSQRVRTIVYNPEHVSEDEIANLNEYADLANPEWGDGRICMRPASHIYTVSLFSSLIYHLGEDEARAIIDGIVANSPRYIDSDTRQIEAVYAGECDVALINHYYLGRLRDEGSPAGDVALKWLNQDSTGTFYNINGAGVTANAEHRDEAIEFIEYFSALEGQAGTETGFPGSNYEFPTNFDAQPHPIIADFGEFQLDLEYPLWEYGDYQAATVDMLEAAGFGFEES